MVIFRLRDLHPTRALRIIVDDPIDPGAKPGNTAMRWASYGFKSSEITPTSCIPGSSQRS
jgi:hypothetical protein